MERGPQRNRLLIGIASAGTALTAIVALARSMTAGEAFELVVVCVAAAAGAGVVGAALTWVLRRRTLAVQVTVVALTAVTAVAAGVWAAARWMFLEPADVAVLDVVLAAAGTVGALAALVLGSRVAEASASLAARARLLGRDATGNAVIGDGAEASGRRRGLPDELARLERALDDAGARLAASRARTSAVEQSRRELVAWMSHDLRAPLEAIRASVQALDAVGLDGADAARHREALRVQAERLSELVDDLTELSRLDGLADDEPLETTGSPAEASVAR